MFKFWYVLYFLAFSIAQTSIKVHSSFLVLGEKSFAVEGFSNIGKFVCKYEFQGKDTIFIHSHNKSIYEIPIGKFGCGNLLLNHNFKETLKEEIYPKAELSISDMRYLGANDYVCKAELHLAGKRLRYPNFVLRREQVQLVGLAEIKITDLGLQCPNSIGGLVKVDNKVRLRVSFQLQ